MCKMIGKYIIISLTHNIILCFSKMKLSLGLLIHYQSFDKDFHKYGF